MDSSKRKYLSGAEKRKRKKETLEEMQKNRKIHAFFPSQAHASESGAGDSTANEQNKIVEGSFSSNMESNTSFPLNNFSKITFMETCEEQINSEQHCEKESDKDTTGIEYENQHRKLPDIKNIPRDMGYFQNKIIDDDIKRLIIHSEPFQPKGPFKKDAFQGNRHFSENYYYCAYKYGQIKRSWLCYSEILDAAYCEPCWLFSAENNPWRTGIRDWQGLSKKIKTHANSLKHIQACHIRDQWKKNKTIDSENEEKLKEKVSFWKMVLKRLFDITLMMSKNSLSFRGHREQLDGSYNGNFLSIVSLLAKYDDILKKVINKPKNSIKYLSPQIQNEVIECLGIKLENSLISEINSSPFFSIIADTTQDITKTDQMSLICRFVCVLRNEDSIPTAVDVKETFLGFYNTTDRSADGMTQQILLYLENNKIDMKKCRGQGYDGASVMRGTYNSVSTKIKNIQPLAHYVHCASHNLNLVINDAVSGCREVSNFFMILQQIYSFFGSSINRWDLLSNFTGESELTLKKLNPTRWSSRINSINAIKYRYIDIIKALTEISLKSIKKEERLEASQILKKISNFKFVFICVILHNILSEINYGSKILQQKHIDLQTASNVLEQIKTNLKNVREKYDFFKTEASNLCKKWNIPPEFAPKRHNIIKRQFGEFLNDHKFENSENIFKVNVFYTIIDIVNMQLNERFEGMSKISKLFNFLQPKNLIEMNDEDLLKSAENLQRHYSEDLSTNFPMQFLNVVSFIKNDITKKSTVKDLADLLLLKYPFLESDFSEVVTAVLLLLTLPVTVATAERSFSKLKLIKSYARNSMGQERLKYLSLLAIENELAQKLDLDELINNFASKKARRVDI